MRAMILAAGLGKRLRPLTDTMPKPMVPALGKPLIAYHLENLAKAGIQEVVINTAYLGEKIENYIGDGSAWGLSVEFSRESAPLETAGGIRNALPLLGEQPFIVINADIWCDYDLARLLKTDLQDALGHLVLIDNPAFKTQGDFSLSNGYIKPEKQYTFSGISLLSPQMFRSLPLDQAEPLAPLLRDAIAQRQLKGEHYQGHWFDCGTVERLYELEDFLGNVEA